MSARTRVLFVAENVTLAQVVRLVTLARALDPRSFDVHFACAAFDPLVFSGTHFTRHPIYSLDARRALGRLARGQRLYATDVLARYVQEELALFRALSPAVVVGDLRVSLTVSAPHAGIPYAALINAYWSRAMVRDGFPLPDHPVVDLLGEPLAARYFPKALPWVLAHFAAPVNRLRKRYGLAPIGDFVDVLLFGDRVLFPDVPYLTPLREQSAREVFLGPVLWSPEGPLPPWWSEAEEAPSSAYVTLGSSGRIDRLPIALQGLAALELPLMVATAGRLETASLSRGRVRTAAFLPGSAAAQRASFVVCNGGSSTAYQALAEGRPVLGIASNLDQYLAMTAIRDRGAGILLRAGELTAEQVTRAGRALLDDPGYRASAARAASELARYDSRARFRQTLAELR